MKNCIMVMLDILLGIFKTNMFYQKHLTFCDYSRLAFTHA